MYFVYECSHLTKNAFLVEEFVWLIVLLPLMFFLNTLRSSLLNFEFLALFLLIPTWHFFLILQSILISFLQVHPYPSNL